MYIECNHQPPCPSAANSDCAAAAVVRAHPEQGWCLLCNGVVLFEDGGCLRPDCAVVSPVVSPPTHATAA